MLDAQAIVSKLRDLRFDYDDYRPVNCHGVSLDVSLEEIKEFT